MGEVYCGPMPLSESFFLLLAAAAIWFWLDTLKAREIGVAAARQACAADGLLLLDETVVGRAVRPARDENGQLRLRRVYAFEYSDTGDNRRSGSVTLLGHEVEMVYIRPRLVSLASPEPHETQY